MSKRLTYTKKNSNNHKNSAELNQSQMSIVLTYKYLSNFIQISWQYSEIVVGNGILPPYQP